MAVKYRLDLLCLLQYRVDLGAVERTRFTRTRTRFTGALGWTARAVASIVGKLKRFAVISEAEDDLLWAYTGIKDTLDRFVDVCCNGLSTLSMFRAART